MATPLFYSLDVASIPGEEWTAECNVQEAWAKRCIETSDREGFGEGELRGPIFPIQTWPVLQSMFTLFSVRDTVFTVFDTRGAAGRHLRVLAFRGRASEEHVAATHVGVQERGEYAAG